MFVPLKVIFIKMETNLILNSVDPVEDLFKRLCVVDEEIFFLPLRTPQWIRVFQIIPAGVPVKTSNKTPVSDCKARRKDAGNL